MQNTIRIMARLLFVTDLSSLTLQHTGNHLLILSVGFKQF